jgi:ATP-dependent protease HslVU (ClpYQ) peptidase subunit
MTTIAYNHKDKQIASEGRSTRDGAIMTDSAKKWKVVDGVTFFLAGSACDYDLFINIYFGSKSEEVPECCALVVDGEKIYRSAVTLDGLFWKQEVEHNDAIGSGWNFALSAMDFGDDARKSVEYAITRDCSSGGKIHIYDIATKAFI